MLEEAIVHHLILTPAPSDNAGDIVVGSPAWFAWLHGATRFRLATPQGLITVRKERSGGGRGGWYWRAYRKQRGRLHRFYLGPDTALTPQALAAASAALGALPTVVPEDRAPALPAVPDSEPDSSGGNRAPLILRTKITPPALRSGLVMRPALVAQLRTAVARPLTLVVAPAGFGKTTLLATWLAERQKGKRQNTVDDTLLPFTFSLLPSQVAWLTLERSDDAPGDFLIALYAALTRVAPDCARPTGVLLQLPYRVDPAHVLDQLLSDLVGYSESVGIVLDDYHVLEDRAVHQLVARLIEHAPLSVHVVIASRTQPPLPLARLRARGLLAEVREPELRFRQADATKLLRAASSVTLNDADAAILTARTDGWVTGLHLAALALRNTADPARVIAAFSGEHRLVADYLLSEVLAELPAHLRRFLHETAILDRLSAPLCATVWSDGGQTARAEAQQLLEELEQRGLFLTPLDDTRTWYRYHPLFAELVRAELVRAEQSAAVAALHLRAADWFITQLRGEGRPAFEAAIGHLLAGDAPARAAELVERAGLQAVFCGETDTLQRWVKALPADAVQARPFLRLAASGHFPRLKNPQRVAEELATLENMPITVGHRRVTSGSQPETTQAETLAVRAYVAQACGDLGLAATLLLDALALLPEAEHALRWRLLVSLGNAYALEGWLAAAHMVLTASLVQAGDDPVLAYLSQSYRAWVDLSMGRVQRAHAVFCRLYADAEAAGWAELPLMGDALMGMGATLAERGQLKEGLAQLERGLTLMRRMGFNAMLLPGELERARIYRALGHMTEARAALAQAAEIARDFAVPFLGARIAAARLDLGLVPAGGPPPVSPLMHYAEVPGRLAWARVAIREGRAGQAREVLVPLLHVAERRSWGWALLSARVLWALACAVEQDAEGMLWALGAALAQGEPEEALLPFLEEGQAVVSLLQRAAALDRAEQLGGREVIAKFLGALVTACSQGSPRGDRVPEVSCTPESLTPREREVLMLMTAGASNAEIAAQLVVTVSTVKAHSRSLFGKLGVANRTQAAARAYHFGLLEAPDHGMHRNRT
jgi:LuxR family transcriptional regulator, maltose regulon positive regulatory protein